MPEVTTESFFSFAFKYPIKCLGFFFCLSALTSSGQ